MNVVDVCGLQCASFGKWFDTSAEATTIAIASRHVYRKLLWQGDQLVGAIFTGHASDVGMLNDVGMVKGILQTQTPLGPWKAFLQENPFDVRRPYVAVRVAEKLAGTTLLGRPARPRSFHFGGKPQASPVSSSHGVYVSSKTD